MDHYNCMNHIDMKYIEWCPTFLDQLTFAGVVVEDFITDFRHCLLDSYLVTTIFNYGFALIETETKRVMEQLNCANLIDT